MGYMTVVSILNDGWHVIKNNPEEFIQNIENGMTGANEYRGVSYQMVNDYRVDNFSNPMEVVKSFHADTPQVFYVGQNCMTMLTDWTTTNKRDIEFQLKRIKEAKSLIAQQAKELKQKLELIKEYETATELICVSDYKDWKIKKTDLTCKAGNTYKILAKRNDYSDFIIETESDPIMIKTLILAKYFKVKK